MWGGLRVWGIWEVEGGQLDGTSPGVYRFEVLKMAFRIGCYREFTGLKQKT